MPIVHITPNFSVSGELSETEQAQVASMNIDTLINVRPDNECEGQTSHEEWEKYAQQHKLQYGYIPVSPCQYGESDVLEFNALLAKSDKGVHAFCRTGTRAVHLWALANKQKYTFEQLQSIVKAHGYNLDMIARLFQAK